MGDGLVALMAGRCSMRITKISVEKLFGIFDHEIPLNLDDRITIIHAPNGYGKTIILKMLYGLFNGQYSELRSVPYGSFKIEFEDSSWLEASASSSSDEIDIQYVHDGSRSRYILQNLQEEFLLAKLTLFKDGDLQKYPIAALASQINIHLIESQRLLQFSDERPSDKKAKIGSFLQQVMETQGKKKSQQYTTTGLALPTVESYAKEMVQQIRDRLADYASVAQALDRSFPVRVLNPSDTVELTDEALEEKLKALEHHRHRLVQTGLLEQEQEQNLQFQHQPLDKSTKNILAVYVEDTEKKLNAFGDLLDKIELFKRIINSKLSYKAMQVDREEGFIFTMKYPNGHNPDSGRISPMDLSSGEQHELVLLYELLFKVQPKSLVLIDEPELSLHVGWQVNFLRDLQEIAKLADIDVLIATHSPSLIHDRWDLTVELKGVSA
jgi:predicted ATP-binding protein involved in virulence